jgi:hypothetical protein
MSFFTIWITSKKPRARKLEVNRRGGCIRELPKTRSYLFKHGHDFWILLNLRLGKYSAALAR